MDGRNLESYLEIKKDSDNFFYYNLNQSVYFPPDMVAVLSDEYVYQGEQWTQLSHKFFGTIHLYWLILAFNQIDNPYQKIDAGKKLRIPKADLVRSILDKIKSST